MFGADRHARPGHAADRVAKRKPGARGRLCLTSRDSSWDLLPCASGSVWTFTAVSRSPARLRYRALRRCGLLVVSCLESISGNRNFISSECAASSIPGRPDVSPGVTDQHPPKMALFVLALFPQFVHPEAGSVAGQIMILASLLNLIGLMVNGLVIFTASRIGRAFAERHRFSRVPQFLLGSVFAGLAMRLALAERR
jgi:hypothetical protein